ncbi:MAG: ATP-binding cassette domain-containing protein [bacterium]|nr:ATP-binding cassette domain-containing protein [bacterium]
MSVTQPAIAAEHLTLQRGGETICEDFSFSITAGAYVAVIGPNGGGKTTLLRAILGLTAPTIGTVQLFGAPASDARVRRRVGYVAQRGGSIDPQFPATVREIVAAGRAQYGGLLRRLTDEDHRAIADALDRMGIARLQERPLGTLSGGERQRALLARALAARPDLLALDEPIDGLDPASREEFYAALRAIHDEGTTILFVTHDVHRIVQEADTAICLRHELVCHGAHACHIGGTELRNIVHRSQDELAEHHSV